MSRSLYAVINPIVKTILRSPFHGLLSKNIVLLEFKGRRSQKTFSTPISYHSVDGRLHCFTDRSYEWWRNLRSGDSVGLTLRGRRKPGRPTVLSDGSETMCSALNDFLVAVPRDALHAGVGLDESGHPIAEDVANAVKNLVFISIEILEPSSR